MRSRRLAALAVWTVTAVVAAGCSDDPERPDEPDRSPSSTTSAATEGSDDASTSTPSTSAVQPATGEQVRLQGGVSFRLTEDGDWGVDGSGTRNVAADASVEGLASLVLLDAGEFPSTTDDRDRSAQSTLEVLRENEPERHANIRRVEDREVNGVEGFVLRSETAEAQYYLFGADHEEISYTIALEVPVELELEDWLEPILASVEWD